MDTPNAKTGALELPLEAGAGVAEAARRSSRSGSDSVRAPELLPGEPKTNGALAVGAANVENKGAVALPLDPAVPFGSVGAYVHASTRAQADSKRPRRHHYVGHNYIGLYRPRRQLSKTEGSWRSA